MSILFINSTCKDNRKNVLFPTVSISKVLKQEFPYSFYH